MEQLELLMGGFASALTPINLLWVLIGALLGTAVGVLPGLGSAMAVALLLPVTFSLEPTAAFIMFAGIYFGGLFGDSTSGILLNTPGHSSAIASTFEGHRMAKSGQAAKALATCAIGAFIGGLIATTLVVFFAPTLVKMATVFGPAEYFALAVFAFLAISAVVSESVIRGIAALGIGLALALVGIDGPSGTARFTLGMPQLFDGISVIVITVGLLALGEVFHIASRIHRDPIATRIETKGRARLNLADFRKALPAMAARHRLRRPVRADPRRRRRSPHLPGLRHRKATGQAPERSGIRHHRLHPRPRSPRSRRQRHRRHRHGRAARTGTADIGHRRDHACRIPAIRHAAGTPALRTKR